MGLRPRTARRLALAGAILTLVLVVLVVAFTLPKYQTRRQLDGFRQDGLAAHERGDHAEAVRLLGRHTRGMGDRPVSPDVRLAYARSRAELEASDGGHLPAAISMYREYLREVADDRVAAAELLTLFIQTGQWVEARELAGRLRPTEIEQTPDADLGVIRDEAAARASIRRDDPLITRIEDRLLSAQSPAFIDVWRAYARALALGDLDRADAVVERYLAAAGDTLAADAIRAIVAGDGIPADDAARNLAQALRMDPDTGHPGDGPPLDDPEMVRVLVVLLDAWRQEHLAMGVLEAATRSTDDPEFSRTLARRRFWAGLPDDLIRQPRTTPNGKFIADVAGYAGLVMIERGDQEGAAAVEAELARHPADFRASGWVLALKSRREAAAGDLVAARASATLAVEKYPFEPTFRFLLGDVHDRLGRLADASESWRLASELAGPGLWIAPEVRRVMALLADGRTTEAGSAADELVRVVRDRGTRRTVIEALVLQLRVHAQLALRGQLDFARAQESIRVARAMQDVLTGPMKTDCALHLATFEGALGNDEQARAHLRDAMADATPEQAARAGEIDAVFRLGVLVPEEVADLPERIEHPALALRAALGFIAASPPGEAESRIESALRLIAAGIAAAGEQDRAAWLRADAIVKDRAGRPDAAQAWQAAIQADPKNVELLTEAIESEAMVYDRGFVESTINKIIELTSTQGRTPPTRLRLARARSIFGREPTRASRDEAIVIVRSVVVAEPQNLGARTLLANMLQFPCPPRVPAEQRYERDLTGAVEQYLAASQLIGGPASLGYLFTAADLCRQAGNEERARQILLDVSARAGSSPAARGLLARELTRLGDPGTTTALLGRMFEQASGDELPVLGLLLAQSHLAAGDAAAALRVLDRIAASAEKLRPEQLLDLAARYTQAGHAAGAEAVLANAERYGLTRVEAEFARAEVAALFGDGRAAGEILARIVEADPANVDAWMKLIETHFRAGDTEEAVRRADEALAVHPENDNLRYWREMAAGNASEAVRLRAADAGNESVRLAIERVEAYEKAKASMTRADRLARLQDLRRSFINNPAVLKYVARERADLEDDAAQLATDSIADARRFPDDAEILRLAAIQCLRAGRLDDAQRLATSLRSRTRGSTFEADLIFAEAAQASGDHAAVVERLSSWIQPALAEPGNPRQRAVAFLYSAAALTVQGEPAVRNRLEPVARQSPEFGADVWLRLAAGVLREAGQAEGWIRSAEQFGQQGAMQLQVAGAWLAAAERFPARATDFAANAARIAVPKVAENPDGFEAVFIAARAYHKLASLKPDAEGAEAYAKAEEFYLRAAGIQPDNYNHLFAAAVCADAAGRSAEAERHYRLLLDRMSGEDLFTAAIRNNLAGVISRTSPSRPRLEEALTLADAAIQHEPVAAFYGTRGWILLALGRPEDAAADFTRVAESEGGAVEGWLGLAAVYAVAQNRPDDLAGAIERARAAAGPGGLDRELRARVAQFGVPW